MKTKRRFQTRICIVDKRKFEVNPKRSGNHHHHHHGNKAKYRRPNSSVTCSRRCSRLYFKHRNKYLKIKKTNR